MSLAVTSAKSLLKCSFGMAPTPLIVLPSRTVVAEFTLMGNIMDMAPLVNIEPFGLCFSPLNPEVIAAMGVPMPCLPVPVSPWISESINVLVQGFPALDQTSVLICAWAGVINVLEPGNINVMVP